MNKRNIKITSVGFNSWLCEYKQISRSYKGFSRKQSLRLFESYARKQEDLSK